MVDLVASHGTVGLSAERRAQTGVRAGRGPVTQRLEVIVTDGTGKLELIFFGNTFHSQPAQAGHDRPVRGTVSSFRGRRQLVHPEYELLPETTATPLMTAEIAEEFANELIPVYPASAKLSSWKISRAMDAILDTLEAGEDPFPAQVRERHGLWPRELAIRAIHRPQDRAELHHAQEAAQVGRGVHHAGRAGAASDGRRRAARGAPPAGSPTASPPRSTSGCRSR